MRRWAIPAAALAVLVAGAVVPVGAQAPADPVPPALELGRRSLPPGEVLELRGTGFAGVPDVSVEVDGTRIATVNASTRGRFRAEVTVPASLQPGEHRLVVRAGPIVREVVVFRISTPWSTAGFDAGGSGFNRYENTLSVAVARDLAVAWTVEPGPGEELDAEPVEVDGTVYAAFGAWRQGTRFAIVRAYDAGTGALQWNSRVGEGGITLPLTVAGGLVVAGDRAGGGVVALDADDGRVRWRGPGGEDLVVADGVVYTAGPHVDALDLHTGAVRWHRDAGGSVSLTLGSGAVFVADVDGNLTAFERGSGRRRWTVPLGTRGTALTFADGRVWFAAQGRLRAVAARNGAEVWVSPPAAGDGFVRKAVAVTPGRVYAYGEDRVVAIDTSSGAVAWQVPLDGEGGQPTVANGVVYVQGDELVALDAASGTVLRRVATGSAASDAGSAVVTNGRVYAGGAALVALAPRAEPPHE